MHKKVLVTTIFLLFLAMFALPLSAVSATKPQKISGIWVPTSTATIIGPEHTGGGNHFDVFTNTGMYTIGPITGTFEQTVTVILHTGQPIFVEEPPMNFLWKIDRTIQANIDGKSGTVVMRLNCKGSIVNVDGSSVPSLEGTWVIISATDGLAGLHGQGTWWNSPPMRLEYEGQIHFD